MTRIEVKLDSLMDEGREIRSAAAFLEGKVRYLENLCRGLLTEWNAGTAKAAFEKNMKEANQSLESLKVILDLIGKTLDASSNNYRDAEGRNTRVWETK